MMSISSLERRPVYSDATPDSRNKPARRARAASAHIPLMGPRARFNAYTELVYGTPFSSHPWNSGATAPERTPALTAVPDLAETKLDDIEGMKCQRCDDLCNCRGGRLRCLLHCSTHNLRWPLCNLESAIG